MAFGSQTYPPESRSSCPPAVHSEVTFSRTFEKGKILWMENSYGKKGRGIEVFRRLESREVELLNSNPRGEYES